MICPRHMLAFALVALTLTATSMAAAPATSPAAGKAEKGDGAGLGQDTVVVDEKTETIIKGALKWLASKQMANGSWTADGGQEHAIAMTGYALMAFMSAGHLPDEGEHGKNVTAGMNFLLSSVKADGFIQSGSTNMYGHGIATIALGEMYGQSRDQRIKLKLEAAIKLIVNCQNEAGGWRYAPRMADADISVTVLQVVALRAARNSGLEVPQKTIDRAVEYVRTCYDDQSGGFTYQPRNKSPGFARTAAAIYSLQVCGQYDDKRVKAGSTYLWRHKDDRQYFSYGNFYAAPAQYMIGGETWRQWYTYMSDLLVRNAQKQGETYCWEPRLDQGGAVGRIYSTAVYVTILAMPYHYIPLYQR